MLWIVAAVAAARPALAQGPPPAPVRVDAVREEPVQDQRRVTGELRAVQRTLVATREGGIVIAMPAREGDRVKAGDVLCRLDGDRLTYLVAEANAAVELAEAQREERETLLVQAQTDYDALLDASQRSAANPKELADAASEVSAAKARLAQATVSIMVAKARAGLLQARLDDMVIKSPFDGVVVAVTPEVGAWVAEGDTIVDLVSTGSVEAWIDIPQENAAALVALVNAAGDKDDGARAGAVRARIDATGEMVELKSVRTVPVVDRASRTFPIVAVLPDQGIFKPGMSLTAWVPTSQVQPRLTVARDAIMRGPTGTFVYVVRGGPEGPGAAASASLDVLFEFGDRAAVSSRQLRPGDLVVVEGNERLYPGAPVMATNAVPEGQPAAGDTSGGPPAASR